MDDATRREIRLLMLGDVPTADGRTAPGLSLEPADAPRFSLGPGIDLPPGPVTEAGERTAAALTAERFTLTAKSLPGAPTWGVWRQHPAPVGLLVGERDVAPDPTYDRTTRWVSGGLALGWIVAVIGTLALDRGAWIPAVFIGAFVFGLPAYLVSSYRGRGFTGVVAVAELSSLVPLGPTPDGTVSTLPVRIRIGVARVSSHQSIGRNLGRRYPRGVEQTPATAALRSALYQHLSREASASGVISGSSE